MEERIGMVCLTVLGVTLILSSLSYCQNNDRLIAEAIRSGLDPVAVKCAYKASGPTYSGNGSVCR